MAWEARRDNLIHTPLEAIGNSISAERRERIEAPVPQILRHVEEHDSPIIEHDDVAPPFTLGIDRQHHRIALEGLAPHITMGEVLLEF